MDGDSELLKDIPILEILHRLRQQLGPNAFMILDHWESELCAIGIASPADPRQLVYISTSGEPDDRFFVELETAPTDEERIYDVAGTYESVDFESLVRLIRTHLHLESPKTANPQNQQGPR